MVVDAHIPLNINGDLISLDGQLTGLVFHQAERLGLNGQLDFACGNRGHIGPDFHCSSCNNLVTLNREIDCNGSGSRLHIDHDPTVVDFHITGVDQLITFGDVSQSANVHIVGIICNLHFTFHVLVRVGEMVVDAHIPLNINGDLISLDGQLTGLVFHQAERLGLNGQLDFACGNRGHIGPDFHCSSCNNLVILICEIDRDLLSRRLPLCEVGHRIIQGDFLPCNVCTSSVLFGIPPGELTAFLVKAIGGVVNCIGVGVLWCINFINFNCRFFITQGSAIPIVSYRPVVSNPVGSGICGSLGSIFCVRYRNSIL